MSSFTLIDAAGNSVTDTTLSLNIESVIGLGMPDVTNITIPYAVTDGALFQRAIVPQRTVTLVCSFNGTSLANLHALKKALIQRINRDVTAVQGPVYLRYSGSGTAYEIPLYYEGGIDTGMDGTRFNKFALRFVAPDPFWRATSDSTANLTASASVANIAYVVHYDTDGTVETLGGGVNGEVFAIARDPTTGYIWVGGAFTIAYNGPGATNGITANRVAFWDGTEWNAVYGTGVDGTVKTISFHPGGVYVGGSFTQTVSPDVACNGIIRFDSDGLAAQSFGNGVHLGGSNEVRAILALTDGSAYVGGIFDYVIPNGGGSVANSAGIARWTGSDWESITTTASMNGSTLAIARGLDGAIYIGGIFTTINSVSASAMAKYSGGVWMALGTGMASDAAVYALAVGPDGSIYAGGAFTTADSSTALRVAKWNGVGWYALGSGLGPATETSEIVRALSISPDGDLYAGCVAITNSGSITIIDNIARWNGSSWGTVPLALPDTPEVRAVLALSGGELYAGFNTSGTVGYPAVTVVNNTGTERAYPVITITYASAGSIYSIANLTTGDEITFAPYALSVGEIVTINLSPGVKSITSNLFGNISHKVIPGSNVATWCLMPGNNSVAVYSAGTVVATWRNRHWSAD